VVPAVVVQASPEDIGTSARLDYYRQVLDQLRSHVGVRDRVMNLALARRPEKTSRDPAEWLDMREAVVYALELLRVKVVFVDEAQHLMYVDTPHKPTAQLDWLKALTNRTNVLHVLVGILICTTFAISTRKRPDACAICRLLAIIWTTQPSARNLWVPCARSWSGCRSR
jgi:hypothetical protein